VVSGAANALYGCDKDEGGPVPRRLMVLKGSDMTLPQTPSFSLDGKTALVAGASSGIGLACAVALGQAGASVVLAARSSDLALIHISEPTRPY